jgi:hypothetical protein
LQYINDNDALYKGILKVKSELQKDRQKPVSNNKKNLPPKIVYGFIFAALWQTKQTILRH